MTDICGIDYFTVPKLSGMFMIPFLVSRPMRFFVSLLFLGCLGGIVFLSGCDRPEHEVYHYGTIIDQLPDIPEAKEPFELPEIEGIDRENLLRKRF